MTCLVLLMVLVTLCTFAQVHLGTYGAVKTYIRAAFVCWSPAGSGWRIPVFPGGGLVGAVLLANLVAAQAVRLRLKGPKAWLWAAHLGLILLFAGEFATAFFQSESQVSIREGASARWSEDVRRAELALVERSEGEDTVFAVRLDGIGLGRVIRHPGLPFETRVLSWHRNSSLRSLGAGLADGSGRSASTQGVGRVLELAPEPPVSRDDMVDQPSAVLEISEGGRSLGTWLVSFSLKEGQAVEAGGRAFRISLRPERRLFPFRVTIKDFRRDIYPGTDIPRHFSSLVRLEDPERGEDRDVLISMNRPLRYRGRTLYQSGFGEQDTVSVLQVVENPAWILPYLACALVAVGLLAHFAGRLGPALREPA